MLCGPICQAASHCPTTNKLRGRRPSSSNRQPRDCNIDVPDHGTSSDFSWIRDDCHSVTERHWTAALLIRQSTFVFTVERHYQATKLPLSSRTFPVQWQHIGRSASVFGKPSVEVSADYLVGKTKRNRNAKMLLPLRGDFDQQPSCPSYDMQLEWFLHVPTLLQSFAHGWIASPTLQVKDHENSSPLKVLIANPYHKKRVFSQGQWIKSMDFGLPGPIWHRMGCVIQWTSKVSSCQSNCCSSNSCSSCKICMEIIWE